MTLGDYYTSIQNDVDRYVEYMFSKEASENLSPEQLRKIMDEISILMAQCRLIRVMTIDCLVNKLDYQTIEFESKI